MVGKYVCMIVAPKTRKGTLVDAKVEHGRLEYLFEHDPRFDDHLAPVWVSEEDVEVCERPTDKQVVAINLLSKYGSRA